MLCCPPPHEFGTSAVKVRSKIFKNTFVTFLSKVFITWLRPPLLSLSRCSLRNENLALSVSVLSHFLSLALSFSLSNCRCLLFSPTQVVQRITATFIFTLFLSPTSTHILKHTQPHSPPLSHSLSLDLAAFLHLSKVFHFMIGKLSMSSKILRFECSRLINLELELG